MKRLFLFFVLLSTCPTATTLPAAGQSQKEVIAYVFARDRALDAREIDAKSLTRINYAFANIENGEIAAGFAHDSENFQTLTKLREANPKLAILISVGGWTWSGRFSDMALTRASRAKFISSAIRFVENYRLDGVDIDWEYPGLPGIGNRNRPEDKKNYTALLKELRAALNRKQKDLGRHLYSSVATGAAPNFLEHTEMKKVQRYVDSVNLMSYDYYEPTSDRMTGHHAALYTDPKDPKAVSADASVKAYLNAGVPAMKIVLGVPFYGHAWSEVDATNHGLFEAGKEARVKADYKDIVHTLLPGGYIRYWDDSASAPYLYNATNKTFVSYEDVQSVTLKSEYVLKNYLGGIMFWEYSGDSDGALLQAISKGLAGSSNVH